MGMLIYIFGVGSLTLEAGRSFLRASNLCGGFDNIAWICAHENGLLEDLRPNDIGLFSKKMRAHPPLGLRSHVQSETLTGWRTEYAKTYRAH